MNALSAAEGRERKGKKKMKKEREKMTKRMYGFFFF